MKVLEQAILSYYDDNMAYDPKPKLYNTEAPSRVTFPYITFMQISGVTANALKRNKIEDFLYQFNIYSTDNAVEEINDIYEDLKTVFDDCTLVITGYNFIDMDRNFSKKEKVKIKSQSIWQYVIQYRININD